jgi:uncharacterized protein
MNRSFPVRLAVVLATAVALPAMADTILHLANTETVMVHPDRLIARLRAEAIAPNAALAQQMVNKAIASALAKARQTQGVEVSTEGYTTWQPTEPERWQASQTIVLKSQNGAQLVALTGRLQAAGLAVSELSWQLSPEAMRKARDQAMREAIGGLRGRADEAASLLGLRFESFQRVNLVAPQIEPLPRAVMAMSASLQPSAAPENVPVSATAEADAVLGPQK